MCSRLSFRLLSWLGTSLVVASLASSTQAAELIIRPDVIALRNNSGSSLYFFIYDQVSWSRFSLASGDEAELPLTRVILAIPTTSSDLIETGPPQQPLELIKKKLEANAYYRKPPHFFRELRSKLRWELCWSSSQNAWVVQPINDSLCR